MRNTTFESLALEQLQEWVSTDFRTASKLLKLIKECAKTPYEGSGNPEALKHHYSGLWSRRINSEHRLVYQVTDETICIVSCKNHYGDK